jgi:hypothetical protein
MLMPLKQYNKSHLRKKSSRMLNKTMRKRIPRKKLLMRPKNKSFMTKLIKIKKKSNKR